jgi:hypothetical protein
MPAHAQDGQRVRRDGRLHAAAASGRDPDSGWAEEIRIQAGAKPEDRTFTLRLLSTRGGVAEKEITL